ncbi:methyltransferase CmcJ [Colletotrichum scovillei]|uniref:Methyltransferase CmcJ n=1 Tax=Colletotrichum scovillei TaxID=1209932 RepID=A0A9P7R7K6_9PEZI|nr:methyltransferase CmcJ [Colletotrichum scovillei]KAG7069854.1 methyltransferase CmcJ [Colletotrichum scovillei]KAG7073799.1 methyltransferase CmcJ [Colletotrichum scovillei]
MAAVTAFFERTDLHKTAKPYSWDGPDGQSFPKSNFVMKDMELNLTDIRTLPDFKPTIEENGFCFLENKSKELSKMTGADDCKPYLEEMAQFLKSRFGTDEIFPINANFRDARSQGGRTGHLPFAHLDNTVASSWSRISLFLTEEERQRVLSGQSRARIINIWRPMFNHAEDIPFAVCDPRTNIDLADVVSVDRITHEAAKEVAYFSWNPAHRWYWMSNQTPDEIVIMTQYDTHPPGGFFNIVPHAAFRNGAARPGCPTRYSVEARFIVLEPAPYQKDGPGPNGPFPEESRLQPWKEWVTPPEPKAVPAPTADARPMYF